MSSVNFKSIGIYHPQNMVTNEALNTHFASIGQDNAGILERVGIKTRYISSDSEENCVTMGERACEEALSRAGLTGAEIDLWIFTSGTPEYLAPSNALMLHRRLGGKKDARVFDLNANCVGMIVGVENASRYMLDTPEVRYAIVIGSEQMHRYSSETDMFTYSGFGDAACAVILERDENEHSGFIASSFHTGTAEVDMVFPKCGLSGVYSPDTPASEKLILWTGGFPTADFVLAKFLIEDVLKKGRVDKSDIAKFFISQVSIENIAALAKSLDEDMIKFPHIGDRYGYTGTSSPFLAFYHTLAANAVKHGDYLAFWSVGTGYTACALLWKF